MRLLPFAVAAALLAAAPASAQDRPEGWQTWTWGGNCFAVLYASKPDTPVSQPGKAYIAVKHIPSERNFDGVAVVAGLGDISGAEATLDIDGTEWPLLVYGEAGFVRTGDPEKKLVEALSKGKEARVTWFRQEGLVIDTYKIAGFDKAKKVIDAACPRPASK